MIADDTEGVEPGAMVPATFTVRRMADVQAAEIAVGSWSRMEAKLDRLLSAVH